MEPEPRSQVEEQEAVAVEENEEEEEEQVMGEMSEEQLAQIHELLAKDSQPVASYWANKYKKEVSLLRHYLSF